VAFCESHRPVIGPPVLRERLLDHLFEIGPNTFFQTNTRQAERLFALALDMAGGPVDEAWDLYCGVGALTLPLARRAGHVVGAELIEASVAAARRNAAANGVTNVEFVAVDMRHGITAEGLVDPEGRIVARRPDLVLVDPPRDGLHADVTAGLVALAPPRLVYVSCNPATLARDAARLVAGGYRLTRSRAVDMFPQTAHVEMVALFTRG
jgi:23S rRNA (uracil1939-C5)-methyltransferase